MSTFNGNNIENGPNDTKIEMNRINSLRSNSVSTSRRASPSRAARDLPSAAEDAEHLLNKRPPVAKPEFDDDDELDIDDPKTPQPGVDDGFFVGETDDIPHVYPSNGIDHRRRPSYTPSNFPFAPGFGPGSIADPNGQNPTEVNVNVYQQKKTLAQGMMDLALLSANANQLRYVLESYNRHPYYYPSIIFISLSLFFQIAVGIGLILNSRYNVNKEKEICQANRINNFTVLGIFIVTVVNVFISAFGVAEAPRERDSG